MDGLKFSFSDSCNPLKKFAEVQVCDSFYAFRQCLFLGKPIPSSNTSTLPVHRNSDSDQV